MYYYLFDCCVVWCQVFIGGVIILVLFVLGCYGIGVYIVIVVFGSVYGLMGVLVILLVWIYYVIVVFFVGVLMIVVIDE